MTTPRRPAPSRRRTQPALRIRPLQVLVMVVVLAAFVAGLVVGGLAGALIVGALAIASGVWLVLRWAALPERVRIFRAAVVVIGLAVAISLLYR